MSQDYVCQGNQFLYSTCTKVRFLLCPALEYDTWLFPLLNEPHESVAVCPIGGIRACSQTVIRHNKCGFSIGTAKVAIAQFVGKRRDLLAQRLGLVVPAKKSERIFEARKTLN